MRNALTTSPMKNFNMTRLITHINNSTRFIFKSSPYVQTLGGGGCGMGVSEIIFFFIIILYLIPFVFMGVWLSS